MDSPINQAVLLAVVLTGLICVIETLRRSESSLRACITLPLLFYSIIYIVGNTFSTLLAAPAIASELPDSLSTWLPFFLAFAGVFAFQGIIGNTNITVFGRGVLTIEEWISRARDLAVAAAVKKQVMVDDRTGINLANKLAGLAPEALNTYVAQYLGEGTVAQLDAAARQSNADPLLYKALALASREPAKASAILREVGRRRS